MEKIKIYQEIDTELKKMLLWTFEPSEEEGFDIYLVYNSLLSKYSITMSFGFIHPIYALVDILCDSIRHSQH